MPSKKSETPTAPENEKSADAPKPKKNGAAPKPHNFNAGADGSETCLDCGGEQHTEVHGFSD